MGGSVWVLDTGNDRLVRFDSTLARATTHGRTGQGPGELKFAMDLVVDGPRLLVAETGNGRVSVFDSSGAFQRAIRTAGAPSAIALAQGSLVSAPGLEGFYARRADTGRGHARVPRALATLARSDPAAYPSADPFLTADPGGPLYVVDASVLAVAAYDRSGRLLAVRLLPEPFRSALLDRRTSQTRAWGARAASFVSSPVTKRISMAGHGRILVTFPLPDHWGLLIDPRSWSARPLALPEEGPARDILWSAADVSLHGDRLYALGDGRLFEFQVDWN
jgi:hypothetical protein